MQIIHYGGSTIANIHNEHFQNLSGVHSFVNLSWKAWMTTKLTLPPPSQPMLTCLLFPKLTWSAGQHCLVGRGGNDCFFYFWRRQCQQIANKMSLRTKVSVNFCSIWGSFRILMAGINVEVFWMTPLTGFSQRKPHPIISRLHWKAHPRLYTV